MKCNYCDSEEATETILNPNIDDVETSYWDVCKDCKDTIKYQMQLSFGAIMEKHNEVLGKKLINESHEKLQEIAERTKKPILVACIEKKKDGKISSSSVEYTGE